MEAKIKVGDTIAALRQEKGVGLRELSRLTGANIWRIESGQYEPRQETLRKIAKALGVEVYELLK